MLAKISLAIVICVFLISSICFAQSAELTKEDILALIMEFDNTLRDQDVERNASLFTDDAIIDMVAIPPFDKEGQKKFLEDSWAIDPTLRDHPDASILISAPDKVGIIEHTAIYAWPGTGYPIQWYHLCIKDCVLESDGPKIKKMTAYGDWAAEPIQADVMPRRNLGDMIPSFKLPEPEGTGLSYMKASAELMSRLNSRNLSDVAKMISKDADVRFPFIDRPATRSEFIDIYEQILGGFPDAYWENIRRVDMGDGWVFSEAILKGTNNGILLGRVPTKRPMNVRAGLVEHYDNTGLATYVHFHFDTLSMPGQEVPAEGQPITGMAPVNDIQMYYEIHGDGQPLILLHGGFGNAGYWENQIPVLAEKYKVIAVDSRGQGRSTNSDKQIGYSLMASDVIKLMDYLKIEKADVVGWSDGGIICLDLAINYPERLNKVVAYAANYNPSGVIPDAGENEKIIAYGAKASEDYKKLSPDPSGWDKLMENLGNMWATEPNFTPKQLNDIKVPILILDGDSDEFVFAEHTKEMASLIPTAKLKIIHGTGHFAPWEKPKEFNQIVLDYLKNEDFSNTFFMSLDAGLNMISLPLKPSKEMTARDLMNETGSTVVIKYDTNTHKFTGFSQAGSGDGFNLEGGKGYILNVPESKVVPFVGAAWTNEPPLAPPSELKSTGWAFVFSGAMSDYQTGDYTATAKNLRTGNISTDSIVAGRFNVVFADLNRNSVIEAGDKVEIVVKDSTGNIVAGLTKQIGTGDIQRAFSDVTVKYGYLRPQNSVLLQNYPNPFNPETWIPFNLAKEADVNIRIYDSSGKLVRGISLGHKEPGVYMDKDKAIHWDGKSDTGDVVSSGIYFYTIQAGEFSATRKMIVKK